MSRTDAATTDAMTLTAEQARVWYRSPVTIVEPTSATEVLAAFEVDRGTNRIRQVAGEGFMARPADPDPEAGPEGAAPASAADPVAGSPSYTG